MELVISQVSKSYANVVAINNLSFSVSQGEIFALLGPNGAGKSSIIRMITGFTKPDSGKINLEIDGQVYDAIPSHQLGYLPEDRGLYPEKSLLKNILYFAQLNGMHKDSALIEADKWLESFDLLERKNDQLKSLSKGNQQKVQLITAVIHNPSWVILDEPFSGLDPVNQEKVVDFLSELTAKGMTVILSAHQMAMVEKLAKRILLMNKGEAVFYGNLADFQEQEAGQTKVRVTFSADIDENLATSILETFDYQWLNERKLEIALNVDRSLNDLLADLPKLGEVLKVQSEQLDLHQLYLQAITKHGVPAHE
ncbi:ABC transporter ATP-binding protein [Glaciecola sp. MF2-115]|uniref:ABC transporter ATP-binding protein n=1 Tax=Glaciecola sp. MF2-115 TaxID=3384827 RepID=UPI00399FE399